MRAKNLLLTGALSALIFTGCTDNNDNSTWGETDAVVFNSQISSLSTRVSNNVWTDDDEVGIYMTTSDNEFENRLYTAKADGTLTATTGNALKYPNEGTASFIAYYPYSSSVSNKTVTVSVADQTDPTKLDLLYSNNATGVANGETVNLTFGHKLSQIVLNIGSDETITSTSGLTVTLSGMNTTANFNLADGTLTATDSKATITLNVNDAGTVAEAIILPTTSLEDTQMSFTLNGKTFTWDMSGSSVSSYADGCKYTYTATLSTENGKPTVTMGAATIEEWTDKAGGNINVDFSDGTVTPITAITITADAPYSALTSGQGDFTIKDVTTADAITNIWAWDATYSYMKASGYSGGSHATESWLISPAIDLSQVTAATLTFSHKLGHAATPSTDNTLWITEAGDTENWQQLTISEYSASNWTEVNTSIDLASYIGKTVIFGFKYTSTASAASTWEVYNFKVASGSGSDSGTTDPDPSTATTLSNTSFETWTDSKPDGWGRSSVTSATYSQGTDAQDGSYAVVMTGSSSNARFGSTDISLEAGTYTLSVYAKNASGTAKLRMGWVPIVDGTPNTSNYNYILDSTTLGDTWTQYSSTFTLDATTTLSIFFVNAKSGLGNNLTIDNVSLTKN